MQLRLNRLGSAGEEQREHHQPSAVASQQTMRRLQASLSAPLLLAGLTRLSSAQRALLASCQGLALQVCRPSALGCCLLSHEKLV